MSDVVRIFERAAHSADVSGKGADALGTAPVAMAERVTALFPSSPPSGEFWRQIDSERVLRLLLQNLEGMLFRCAVDADWKIHFVSDGSTRLTGYTPRELVSDGVPGFDSLRQADDRARVNASLRRAAEQGGAYRVEYRLRCRDASEKWVLERGVCILDERGRQVIEGFVEDITEQRRDRLCLAETELRYRSIFENSVVGMFQTSEDGHYLAANQALATLYGYETPQDLMGQLSDIANRLYVEPSRRREFAELIRRPGGVRDFESEVFCRDGRRIWIAENAHAVHGPAGELLYYEGTVEDISDRRQHQAQLEYQATHDPLTGLPNRNLLQDRLIQAIHHARRQTGQVAVACIDLDNFKVINDTLGHAVGDQLLKEIADRLRRAVRVVDTVSRYGGDEFVLILGGHADPGQLLQTLERVLQAVRVPLLLGGHELHVGCSIGASLYPHDGDDLETLLRYADAAMYHAKYGGKGRFCFYTPALNAAAHERLAMEAALRHALDNGELQVVYQPKVDAEGLTTGCEALLRWSNPKFGDVSPVRFIPLAEETGLITAMTDFVLRTACREAASWPGQYHVAVNLSARQLSSDSLVSEIEAVLAESGLPTSRLQLEITESMLIGDVERTIGVLNGIKALGARIAVDDFGTGYSSLAYLKRLPIDILKIDSSFVMECDGGQDAMAIPRAVISLGHSLGLHIVAEGVEKRSQMDVLVLHGCEEFQGYLFSAALSAADFRKFLQR